MMTRAWKPAPKSEMSFEPKRSQFAPRPFASKSEEREGPSSCCEPRVDFSLADIDIFPKETVQPKLKLGPVGNRYEQEADRVARRVVETISSPDQGAVQRQEDLEDEDELDLEETLEEDEELRRKVAGVAPAGGADVEPGLESAIQEARGQGQPLSDGVRQPMERAFGADFGRVRVHADDHADRLNRSLQARAFTTGQDIFLRQGEYRPGSSDGQRLLAHELTHVVQQRKSLGCQPTHVQRFWRGYKDDLNLTNDGSVTQNDVNDFVDGLTSGDVRFTDETINAVYRAAIQTTAIHPIENRDEVWYQCVDCRHWFQYEAMDIGHRIDWKTYLKDIAGAKSRDEAQIAYNDLNNLQLECSTCNRSHSFERTPTGEWKS